MTPRRERALQILDEELHRNFQQRIDGMRQNEAEEVAFPSQAPELDTPKHRHGKISRRPADQDGLGDE